MLNLNFALTTIPKSSYLLETSFRKYILILNKYFSTKFCKEIEDNIYTLAVITTTQDPSTRVAETAQS